MTNKQKILLIGIVLVAIFFRYYQISSMPGGLFPDEAANGLDINLMQQGHLQSFYERGNGREALFFYMLWGSVELFGKGPWQHHIVSALVGIISVILCFLVTKRLFGFDAEDETKKRRAINIALLAAFLMAVSTWHIVLSRTAFRAILIPLFTALTFYLLICTHQAQSLKNRLILSFLTGASFALGFYTYIAYRIMAPIILMVLAWPLLAQIKNREFKSAIKRYFWPAVSLLVAFTIFIYPIAKYFYTHPGSFVGRAGQVSIFNPNLYTINGIQLTGKPPIYDVANVAAEVFKTQMTGFFTHGDLNWRSNISGYPFLSPLVSPFFAAGLLLVLYFGIRYFFAPAKKAGWWRYFLLAGWFFGMILPVITTAEGIPHGLRGIGVIPAVFIISAWAIYEAAAWIHKLHVKLYARWQNSDWAEKYSVTSFRFLIVSKAFKLVVVLFVVALFLQAYYLYFIYAANSPENFYYFRSDLTPVSQYLVKHCEKNSTYLILDKFSVQTTDYMTSDPHGNFSSPCSVPYTQVDPEDSWKLSGLKSGDQIVFTESSMFDTKKFKQFHPEAYLAREDRNKFGQAVMAIYKIQ
jgi:4-amino-4-deoxy-L-arabinose transferase-like glycosyltransferase